MGVKLDGLLTQLGTGKWNILHCLALSYCESIKGKDVEARTGVGVKGGKKERIGEREREKKKTEKTQ